MTMTTRPTGLSHQITQKEADEIFEAGVKAVDGGDTLMGIVCLEKLLKLERTPLFDSYYAVCLAKERGDVDEALALCRDAHRKEPANAVHYLNLGRVFLAAGRKRDAFRSFRDGLLFDEDHRITNEMRRMGSRNLRVFNRLPREHLLNRLFGKIGSKLRLR